MEPPTTTTTTTTTTNTSTTSTSTTSTQDYSPEDWLKLALQEAQKCIPSKQAYNVGSLIITQSSNQLLTQGYSRELNGNLHAEQVALLKLSNSIQSIPIRTFKDLCSVWNLVRFVYQIKSLVQIQSFIGIKLILFIKSKKSILAL
ncbi:hypothetical protein DFH28DRAFT_1131470 [Melampsora americana]|nr:hypothetical protein DFH28DRAFT_1131470 [Melampsora americana]